MILQTPPKDRSEKTKKKHWNTVEFVVGTFFQFWACQVTKQTRKSTNFLANRFLLSSTKDTDRCYFQQDWSSWGETKNKPLNIGKKLVFCFLQQACWKKRTKQEPIHGFHSFHRFLLCFSLSDASAVNAVSTSPAFSAFKAPKFFSFFLFFYWRTQNNFFFFFFARGFRNSNKENKGFLC